MIKLRIWVSIKVTGLNLKKVLDRARENGITMYAVKRTDISSMEITLTEKSAESLQKLLPEEEYKIEFMQKQGLLYKLASLKGRYALFVGLIVITALMFILSHRTWFVRVYGAEKSENIITVAENSGAIGKYGDIDTEKIAQAVTESAEEIIWSSVRVKGIVTEIYVKIKPQAEQAESAEKIVASKDGRLLSLTVTGGTAEAEEGTTVLKGQTLISGRQTIGETEYPVNASGKAMAEVWYYASEEVELKEYKKTGREKTATEFSVFGIKVLPEKCAYENFEEEKTEIDTYFLPIRIYKIIYRETEEISAGADRESIAKETAEELEKKIRTLIPQDAKIKDKEYGFEEKDGVLSVWTYTETVEDIAQRG